MILIMQSIDVVFSRDSNLGRVKLDNQDVCSILQRAAPNVWHSYLSIETLVSKSKVWIEKSAAGVTLHRREEYVVARSVGVKSVIV